MAAYAALKIPDFADAPGAAIPQLTRPVFRGLDAPASAGVRVDEATDDTWRAIAERDPSPSLAVLGETYDYGRQVALTFDDGPDPNVTPAILDVLREHDLKATFFVLGYKVARNPEILRRIAQEGHTLGNHTYDHANLADLRVRQMHDEMQSTQEAVDRALGYHYPMTLMRPPYGAPYLSDQHMLPLFQRVMEEQRAYPVMWTVDSRDWELNGQAGSIAENLRTTTSKKGGCDPAARHPREHGGRPATDRRSIRGGRVLVYHSARDAGRQIRRRAGLHPANTQRLERITLGL